MKRDIDRIAERVAERLPEVQVTQLKKHWPADDVGLWWFSLPGVKQEIQIESPAGECPFLVEHDMVRSADAWTARSVEEAVEMIVGYLERVRNTGSG